ncbi:hypothetical protein HSIEG1_3484 [Enterococcus sp. HSIEG1]|nr:hypothetical protein HSIEG1_3484 [Enterococcus sp. HSIEG1]
MFSLMKTKLTETLYIFFASAVKKTKKIEKGHDERLFC